MTKKKMEVLKWVSHWKVIYMNPGKKPNLLVLKYSCLHLLEHSWNSNICRSDFRAWEAGMSFFFYIRFIERKNYEQEIMY